MALVTQSVAPTLDDARRAAHALVGAGAREVWLYGSVARRESEPGSDIDLVAVLDDLEYRRRLRTKRELQDVARAACGRRVEVLVTDRAEWRIQREQVSASFISAVSCDLELLACSSVTEADVDWGKDQVMATSNDELALERLRGVLLNLTKIEASRGRVRSSGTRPKTTTPATTCWCVAGGWWCCARRRTWRWRTRPRRWGCSRA